MEATRTETGRGKEVVRVTCWDWLGAKKASLDGVSIDATVAEVIDEASRAMELPADVSYQAALGSQELNHMESLREIGVESDLDLEIFPDVDAGQL